MDPIVIGIVGAGFAASFHVENYRRVPGLNIRIKGVTAKRAKSAQTFAKRHQLETTYDSIEELLTDPEITIVDLCVPNFLHHPLVIQAAQAGKHIVCEKPLTGYFGDGTEKLVGHKISRKTMFEHALKSADEMIDAVKRNGVIFCYAENWIYAPSIQKANNILGQSENTIFRIVAEESHSGSHSAYAKEWRYSGGGSLFYKGCHPVAGALYLKYNEGLRKEGKPIKPKSVLAQVANLTQIDSFVHEDKKWVQDGWKDCEDWGTMVITFTDDSIAQITAADIVLGGIKNIITVYSSKAVIQCNINPNTSMLSYVPDEQILGNVYIREKVETRAGWQLTNPDEDWMNGFPHELEDFCQAITNRQAPKSTLELARDILAVCYGAYISAEIQQQFVLSNWM